MIVYLPFSTVDRKSEAEIRITEFCDWQSRMFARCQATVDWDGYSRDSATIASCNAQSSCGLIRRTYEQGSLFDIMKAHLICGSLFRTNAENVVLGVFVGDAPRLSGSCNDWTRHAFLCTFTTVCFRRIPSVAGRTWTWSKPRICVPHITYNYNSLGGTK